MPRVACSQTNKGSKKGLGPFSLSFSGFVLSFCFRFVSGNLPLQKGYMTEWPLCSAIALFKDLSVHGSSRRNFAWVVAILGFDDDPAT